MCGCASVKPPETGRLEIWDTRVVGLMLRVTPSGAATWSVRRRADDGRRLRAPIGTWPAIGLYVRRGNGL